MDTNPIRIKTSGIKAIKSPEKVIDYSNHADKKWLMNHMHWAINNSATLTIEPLAESN